MLFIFSCSNEPITETQFQILTLIDNSESGIDFRNDLREGPGENVIGYEYYQNGGGVSVGDVNNDGLPDLFFTGNTAENKLYLNKGNLQFENITPKSGIDSKLRWSTGSTFVDINNDGYLDIFICNGGPNIGRYDLTNQIYINNKDLTFTEQSKDYGFLDTNRSNHASFFDYDRDGDLDVFILNNSNYWDQNIKDLLGRFDKMSTEEYALESNRLYRNEGNNKFTDVTVEAGVSKIGFGLGVSTCDFNNDGWVDIYVANDYFFPDFYFVNQGGTFKDEIKKYTKHTSHFSMGVDAGDINNDGLLDLMVLDMTPSDHIRNKTLMASMDPGRFVLLNGVLKYQAQFMFNTLQLNRGNGIFSDISLYAGLSQTEWSWATLFADLDLDGYQDTYITNGYLRDAKDNDWIRKVAKIRGNRPRTLESDWEELKITPSNPIRNYCFKNNRDNTFKDETEAWGIKEKSFSNGAIYADLDLDGDLDLVVNNLNDFAFLYKNNVVEQSRKNFINLDLSDSSNRGRHLNAKITLHHKEGIQFRELSKSRGYVSSVDAKVHFGLGEIKKIDKIKIQWLNGKVTEIKNPTINKTHKIDLEKSELLDPKRKQTGKPLFANMNGTISQGAIRHIENKHADFEKEILLPHSQSKLGPSLAVGDVDKNGLEDFFIGGAKGQAGVIYLQENDSKFIKSINPALAQDIGYEDLGAVFFDADKDGDLDLYVSSGGGSDFQADDPFLQDRLYLNDDTGQFSKSLEALPNTKTSNGRVKASDFDDDGDLDLFVCGRTYPGKYPYPTKSYLLQNDQGKFKDVSSKYFGEINPLGMVTDMLWTDINKDNKIDILLVGEWMPITVLLNSDGKFINQTAEFGLNETTGWWYSIAEGDFDKDGDPDYVVGNLGLNNKFHPSKEKPFHVYSDDFDNNGTNDIVLSKKYKGNLVPVRGKECSTEQMPFLEEKFPSYLSFASATVDDIFGSEKLASSLHYSVNSFESVQLINNSNSFEIKPLPHEAQISPINAIIVKDFDGDSILDLVIAGNNYNTEVETPAYDAGIGLYLKGQADGYFKSIPSEESGLLMPYNIKDMKLVNYKLNGKNTSLILGGANNSPIQFVALTQ